MPSSMLGTPIACVSPSLHMLGTPNSLKEAFRTQQRRRPHRAASAARPQQTAAPVPHRAAPTASSECLASVPLAATPEPLPPPPRRGSSAPLRASGLSEGEQGLSLGGRRHLPSLAGLSGSQHALPPGSEPHSAGAGSAGAKPKRDRSGGKENGKSKPRSCNCKNSKCIKLYAATPLRARGARDRGPRRRVRALLHPLAAHQQSRRWPPRRASPVPPPSPLVSYCDCFSAGQFCLPSCKCDNCLNNADNEAARDEARKSILERNHHAFTSKVKLLQKVRRARGALAAAPPAPRSARGPRAALLTPVCSPRRLRAAGGLALERVQL